MNLKLFRDGCLALSIALLASGCAQQGVIKQRADPLIGKIVDGNTQAPLSYQQLLERALEADVIYLGERHDNAEHHRIQLQLLQSLIDQGLRPVVGFEFFDTAQTGYLMQYAAGRASLMQLGHGSGNPLSPEQYLRNQLGWAERSDTDWGYYFALIELAKTHQLSLFGADLPAPLKLRLSRANLDGLTAVEQQQLTMMPLVDGDYKSFMYARFRAGHCGWGMEPLLTRLYRTWQERNYRMASSVVAMSNAERQGPVVMILGGGHTEHNWAVVAQVQQQQPQLKQLNIGLQEIYIEETPLEGYLFADSEQWRSAGPRFDLFWFTQRQDYLDPCATLNKPPAK
ncbi:MAG: ChaN family lipoprotein [Motiliproteus sp.]